MKKSKSKKKFKKIVFKLSEKQFIILSRFCKSKRLTPNKVFKKAVKEYIVNNYDFVQDDYHISENQLALFDIEDDAGDDIQDDSNNTDNSTPPDYPKTTLF